MASSRQPHLMATALLALACFPLGGQAHGFLRLPKSRNYQKHLQHKEDCPQCLAAGGPGTTTSLSNNQWPYPETILSSRRHGLCGDSATSESPKYDPYPLGETEVAASYVQGQSIEVEILITAHHMGFFEFHLCDTSTLEDPKRLTQGCLATHTLHPTPTAAGGRAVQDTSYPHRVYLPPPCDSAYPGDNVVRVSLELPEGLVCERCVLQWWWVTANSCNPPGMNAAQFPPQEGDCGWWKPQLPDCGAFAAPEEFWNCADLSIRAPGPHIVPQPQPYPLPLPLPLPQPVLNPVPTIVAGASPNGEACVVGWGKCGGRGWSGPTNCCSGACHAQSEWYSQCLTTGCPIGQGWLCESQSPTLAPQTTPVALPAATPLSPTLAPVEPVAEAQGCAPKWGRCGGDAYTGPTTCCESWHCNRQSPQYSQCVPQAPGAPLAPTGGVSPQPNPHPHPEPQPQPVAAPANPVGAAGGAGCVTEWSQCGGLGWTGATACCQGLTCHVGSKWYHSCIKAASPVPNPTPNPPNPQPQPQPEAGAQQGQLPPPTPGSVTFGCQPLPTNKAHLFRAESPLVGYVGGNFLSQWDWTSPQWQAYDMMAVAFITNWHNDPSQCGGANLWAPLQGYPSLVTNGCGHQAPSLCPQLHNCRVEGTFANQGAQGVRAFQDAGRRKVLISIGGGVADAHFGSVEEANRLAEVLWEMYLGGVDPAFEPYRPFGSVVLDGIDIDVEQHAYAHSTTTAGWGAFVRRLREIMDSDPRKVYYITGAPINPLYSDDWGGQEQHGVFPQAPPCTDGKGDVQIQGIAPELLSPGSLSFLGQLDKVDYLFPQFYNTPSHNLCSGSSAHSCAVPATHCYRYDFRAWAKVVAEMGGDRCRLLIGLPLGLGASNNGFVPHPNLGDMVRELLTAFPETPQYFGGFMGWELHKDPQGVYATQLADLTAELTTEGLISGSNFQPRGVQAGSGHCADRSSKMANSKRITTSPGSQTEGTRTQAGGSIPPPAAPSASPPAAAQCRCRVTSFAGPGCPFGRGGRTLTALTPTGPANCDRDALPFGVGEGCDSISVCPHSGLLPTSTSTGPSQCFSAVDRSTLVVCERAGGPPSTPTTPAAAGGSRPGADQQATDGGFGRDNGYLLLLVGSVGVAALSVAVVVLVVVVCRFQSRGKQPMEEDKPGWGQAKGDSPRKWRGNPPGHLDLNQVPFSPLSSTGAASPTPSFPTSSSRLLLSQGSQGTLSHPCLPCPSFPRSFSGYSNCSVGNGNTATATGPAPGVNNGGSTSSPLPRPDTPTLFSRESTSLLQRSDSVDTPPVAPVSIPALPRPSPQTSPRSIAS